MPVKSTYSIPANLDRSVLDHEIVLSKGGAIPPVQVKVIMFYIGSFIALLAMLTQSFMSSAGVILMILFGLWWVGLTVFLSTPTKTKEMNLSKMLPLMDYLPKGQRRVLTRRNSPSKNLYSIVGIDEITEEGVIMFSDKTVGQVYAVVGNASRLVFDRDRDDILNQVDRFWRRSSFGAEYITVALKEPQRVRRQMYWLEERNKHIQAVARARGEAVDPDLLGILMRQHKILSERVGKEFKSMQQYMIIKANSFESLREAGDGLLNTTDGSNLMIKASTPLRQSEVEKVLRRVYGQR